MSCSSFGIVEILLISSLGLLLSHTHYEAQDVIHFSSYNRHQKQRIQRYTKLIDCPMNVQIPRATPAAEMLIFAPTRVFLDGHEQSD